MPQPPSSLSRSNSPPIPSSLRRPLSSDSVAQQVSSSPAQTHPKSIRHSQSSSSLNSAARDTSILSSRRSSSNLRKPIPTRPLGEPTLDELIRREQQQDNKSLHASNSVLPSATPSRSSKPSFQPTRSGRSTPRASTSGSPRIELPDGASSEWSRFAAGLQSRRSSYAELDRARAGEQAGLDDEPPPESALLFPPLYGRPGPPSPGPDIFT